MAMFLQFGEVCPSLIEQRDVLLDLIFAIFIVNDHQTYGVPPVQGIEAK
jgi:hypothetical protein